MIILSQIPAKTDRYTPISCLSGSYPMIALFLSSRWNSQTETVPGFEHQADYEANGCLKAQMPPALIGPMIGTDTRLNKIYRVARNNQFGL